MRDINRTRLATAICCVGVVVTGWSLENSAFNLAIAATLCIASSSYAASVRSSCVKVAQLFLLNAALLALVAALLRVTLAKAGWRFPLSAWAWLHRVYRVWWLSERTAIILALISAGFMTIQVASKVGGDATRKRFQGSTIVAASVLVVVNIVHFLRPAWCADCFFPYGLPFTFFTEGGYGGGGGFVWPGLVADAALIPSFATICTLLWNQIAKQLVQNPYITH